MVTVVAVQMKTDDFEICQEGKRAGSLSRGIGIFPMIVVEQA